jgi:thiamine-monophosphate kinase
MASETSRTELSAYGEFGLIRHLTKNTEQHHAFTLRGVGDDAAVIDPAGKLQVVTTDLLLEGIHFDLAYTPLAHLGYKAVAVNVSDLAAMNAEPRQITVSVGVSNRFSVEALERLYEGIHAACRRYRVDLVGGDTTSSRLGLVLSVTAIGEGTEEELVYRDGASVGDLICVTGDLGSAYLGLQVLEREKAVWREHPDVQPELEQHAYQIGRQLKPEARVDLLPRLREAGFRPKAMIDVSDGLSSDLLHLCDQGGTGARIREADVPIDPHGYELALTFNMDPINAALNGGEDYELLFCIAPEDRDKLEGFDDVSVIGEMVPAAEGVKLLTKGGHEHELVAGGWNHLRPQNAPRPED